MFSPELFDMQLEKGAVRGAFGKFLPWHHNSHNALIKCYQIIHFIFCRKRNGRARAAHAQNEFGLYTG